MALAPSEGSVNFNIAAYYGYRFGTKKFYGDQTSRSEKASQSRGFFHFSYFNVKYIIGSIHYILNRTKNLSGK